LRSSRPAVLRRHRRSTCRVSAGIEWCADKGYPAQIDRGQVSAWIVHILDSGAQPSTAAARLAGVRQFSKWLAAEGEIDSDPLVGLNVPKVDTPIASVLTDDELRALIKACERGAAYGNAAIRPSCG
jgi:site-specific recombinase XerD